MKLTFKILMVLLVLTSCSSNDDESSDFDINLIIGTWNGASSTIDGNIYGIPDNSIVKFNSNNKTEFFYEGYGNGEDIIETGTWSYNGNILTIKWEDADVGSGTYKLTITRLTDEFLTWETVIEGEGLLEERFIKE